MKSKIFCYFLVIFALGVFSPLFVYSQTPCPRVGPCDMPEVSGTPSATPPPVSNSSPGFNDGLAKFVRAASTVIPAVFSTAEKYLNEYFYFVIGILVGIVVLFSMLHQGMQNIENPNHNFMNWALGICFFSALLLVSGDINGDGRGSDLVESVRYVGYYIGYGNTSPTNTTATSLNPLPNMVNQQVDYYNKSYNKFVDGAFTVQYDPKSLPVSIPRPPTSAEGKMKVLFLDTYWLKKVAGGDIDLSAKSNEDWISWFFQITNLSRTLFELSELFVFLLQALTSSLLRLTFPFLLVFCLDPTLRKQILGTWIDQLITFCFILPIVAQVARFICYMFCNMALYAQSDSSYYTYDAGTASVIQQQSPVVVAGLFAFMSLIMSIILGVGTPALTMALRKFQILPFMTQSVGATFSMLLSTGLSYTTGLLSGSMTEKMVAQRAVNEKQIQDIGAYNAYMGTSDRNMQQYRSTQAMAQGESNVGKWNADTNRQTSMVQNEFEQYSTGVNAGIQFDSESTKSMVGLMKGLSQTQLDKVAKFMNIDSKELSAIVKHTPEVNDLLGKNADDMFILGTLGAGNLVRSGQNLQGQLGSKYINDIPKYAEDLKLNDAQTGVFGDAVNKIAERQMTPDQIKALDLPQPAKNVLSNMQGNLAKGSILDNATSKMQQKFANSSGQFDGEQFMNSFGKGVAQLSGGEKMLSKAGFKSQQIMSLMGGQSPTGMVMPGNSKALANTMKLPKEKAWIASVINDEAGKMGWSPQARLAFLGNVGRENAFNANTIFNGHLDPASFKNGKGAIYNAGIISWNGTRGTALKRELASQGLLKPNGQIVQNEQSLRTMMRFADQEMQTGKWGNQANVMRNRNLGTQDVSKSLQKYILYDNNPAHGYNSYDGNFDVRNNALWANKMVGLVNATSNNNTTIPLGKMRQADVPRMINMGAGKAMATSRPSVNYTPLNVTNPTVQTKQTYESMMTDVRKMGITNQKIFAPIYAEALELQNERGVAEFYATGQSNILNQGYAMEQNQYQRQYDAQIGLAQDKRNVSDWMTNYRYERENSAIDYMHGVKMNVAQDQLNTYQNIAGRDYQVSMAQNNMRFEQTNHEARQQMEIQLISSVTSNLDRQIADMFEKVNSRV